MRVVVSMCFQERYAVCPILSTHPPPKRQQRILGHVFKLGRHAAVALAEWLSITHGDAGIRVSVTCPQAVRTRLLQDSIDFGNKASQAFASMGTLLDPDAVATCALQGIEKEEFLILPHLGVRGFLQKKAENIDRWLSRMRRFLAQVHRAASSTAVPGGENRSCL